MANPVAWFELIGPDGAALQSFYSQAFDWEVDASNPMNYGMVPAAAGGIPGGIAGSPDASARATFYVAVDDVQSALDRVTKLGATMVMPATDVPEGPTIAMFTDPAGNLVGLMKPM